MFNHGTVYSRGDAPDEERITPQFVTTDQTGCNGSRVCSKRREGRYDGVMRNTHVRLGQPSDCDQLARLRTALWPESSVEACRRARTYPRRQVSGSYAAGDSGCAGRRRHASRFSGSRAAVMRRWMQPNTGGWLCGRMVRRGELPTARDWNRTPASGGGVGARAGMHRDGVGYQDRQYSFATRARGAGL
jgi:hypothetical protein